MLPLLGQIMFQSHVPVHVPVHGIVIVMVRSRLAVLEAVRTLIVDSGF